MNEPIKISAGVYLKFHEKLNLSLADCDEITEFVLNEHKDLIKDWINEQADKRRTDLGTNFTLSQLEKFIES